MRSFTTSAQHFVLLKVANFQMTGRHITLRAANQLPFAIIPRIQHTAQIPGTQDHHLPPLRLNLRHKNAFGKEKMFLPLSCMSPQFYLQQTEAGSLWSIVTAIPYTVSHTENLSNCVFFCLIFLSSFIHKVDFSRFCGKKNITARNKLS